ncbi:NDUFA12-domain-containing protein [Rhizopus microsporus]|uniref:NADH dehydrogenase [ubiquinone] 1 alpha subcomplex subunit n=1 Tax=Rhizopus microsporus TaxID=58291 RepID=A0A1X0S4T6_RHIZD|nr:NDUFA12-domain-containing protein [Rhizopus microsporus]
MSTIGRTVKNFLKVGPSSYFKQMNTIGDTKWGRLVGVDANGNKFFENNDEVSGRERWVEYASQSWPDPGDIAPDWHMWLQRIVQEPPTEMNLKTEKWYGEPTPNFSGTSKGFRTYNTTAPKLYSWEPFESYLRIVREWPEDKVRPNRGMKQVLAKKVEEQFRSSSNIDYDKSVQEMKALDYLLDNRFKEKYPISDKILMPAGNPNYYKKLLSSLEANREDNKSLWQRLFQK